MADPNRLDIQTDRRLYIRHTQTNKQTKTDRQTHKQIQTDRRACLIEDSLLDVQSDGDGPP